MEVRTRLTRAERRRRLISAAQKLFGEKGYRLAEVTEIVASAGVTKPMLYKHFPGGKPEIFVAVLDEHLEGLLKALWEAMASSNDPRERLHRGLHAYIRFAEEYRDGFHLLANATGDLDPAVAKRLREVRDTIARGLANTIADVMKGAGLPSEGAPIYAFALLGGVESVVAWWLESRAVPRETLVDYVTAFAWRGFDGLPRDPTRYHRQASQPRGG